MDRAFELRSRKSRVQHARKVLDTYGFLMAFPAIVIVQNISVFVFPFLIKAFGDLNLRIFSVRHLVQIFALLFGVGAIMSVVAIPEDYNPSSLENSLAVLPNYLYWVLLVIILVNVRSFLFFDVSGLYKVIFWGVIASCFYYFLLFPILDIVPIFKRISQNAFAFILICFTPIASYYCRMRYGKNWCVAFVCCVIILAFLSGSRSGSILVFIGSFSVLFIDRLRLRNALFLLIMIAISYVVVFEIPITRTLIYNLNSRTHDLIYNRDEVLRTDNSYLVRVAMIEKALVIYHKYPMTGIGLNNFTNYTVRFPGDFPGAERVLRKRDINETSAHNSYAGMLAEGGLLLLVPFLLILTYCLLSFFRALDVMPEKVKPVFIGLICMSIHLYFIMAIVNVFAWFLIGLACAFSVMVNRRELQTR